MQTLEYSLFHSLIKKKKKIKHATTTYTNNILLYLQLYVMVIRFDTNNVTTQHIKWQS